MDTPKDESFPDPEVPDLDSAGRFVPPWVKFPNIRRRSKGWHMGVGEDYLRKFWPWWHVLTEADRAAYKMAYPEPEEWHGCLSPTR